VLRTVKKCQSGQVKYFQLPGFIMGECVKIILFFLLSLFACGNSNALAPQRTIEFAGYTWNVRSVYGGPGPNYWSDSHESVWLDDNGYLHLKIRKINQTWHCAEVSTNHFTQYGKHKFVVEGDIDNPDQNTVLGLFTYADDTHEIDIEFSRWGNPAYTEIASYTIQPYTIPGNSFTFEVNIDTDVSTHLFDWRPNAIIFTSYKGEKNTPSSQLKNWVYTGNSIPENTDDLRTIINFWLFQGAAPLDTTNLEVIIRDVEQPGPMSLEQTQLREIRRYHLEHNYPNPFNPSTVISWQLAVDSNVELSIYNVLGERVTTLVSEQQKAGQHQVEWQASGMVSGIYYYHLHAGEFRQTKKMILIQ